MISKFPPAKRPPCPKCGAWMDGANVIPGLSAIGARTFLCARCGNLDLIPLKLGTPAEGVWRD